MKIRLVNISRTQKKQDEKLVQSKIEDGKVYIWLSSFRDNRFVELFTVSELEKYIKATGGGAKGDKGDTGDTGAAGADGADGADGREVELQKSATHLQWRYVGTVPWTDLVALTEIKGDTGATGATGVAGAAGAAGADGRDVELQKSATHVQWRKTGDLEWIDLIPLADIKGDDGAAGANGTNGTNGTDGSDGREVELQKSATHIQWRYIGDVSWINLVALTDIKGDTGAAGTNGTNGTNGLGVPAGGTAGQVLAKIDSTDNNTQWITPLKAVYNQSVAQQGAGFSTDTYLTGSSIAIPSGALKVGSRYHLVFDVSKTAAGTAAPVITIRFGTNGTTADTARLTFTFLAQTAAADIGTFEVWVTFRTVGSGTSAVIQGTAQVRHRLQTTGLQNLVSTTLQVTSGGFDSTVANSIIGASVNAGASAAWTVQLVQAELRNIN